MEGLSSAQGLPVPQHSDICQVIALPVAASLVFGAGPQVPPAPMETLLGINPMAPLERGLGISPSPTIMA